MRHVLFAVFFGVYAISAHGKVFHMDSHDDAVVEINASGGEYKVVCMFSPQTKFDSAVNAKINDAKGDSLCKKGIMRYLNAGANDHLSISGLYSLAPVKNCGGKLRYSFAVPVAGCKVMVGAAKPKVDSQPIVESHPEVTDMVPKAQVAPVTSIALPSLLKSVDSPSETPLERNTTNDVRSAGYMSVIKYTEVNGCRSVVSRREYRDNDFGSRQEFDRLCASEFARIRALGEENFRAVRNLGKQ